MASPKCLVCQEDVRGKRSRAACKECQKKPFFTQISLSLTYMGKGWAQGQSWAGDSMFVVTHQSQLIITAGLVILDCCTRNVNVTAVCKMVVPIVIWLTTHLWTLTTFWCAKQIQSRKCHADTVKISSGGLWSCFYRNAFCEEAAETS